MKPAVSNIPHFVQDGIRKTASKLNFGPQFTVDYDFRSGANSSSCVSIIYRITLREEPREVTLLCKGPLAGANDTLLALFEREVYIYQQLLPAFGEFQREHGIEQTAEEFVFAPNCYYAYYDAKCREGILILEDVSRRLFGDRSRFGATDYDHGRLVMVQLGRLHAVSLALKEQHPKLFGRFQQLGDVTKEQVLAMDEFKSVMDLSFDQAIATLNVHETAKKEKLAKLKRSFVEDLRAIGDGEQSEPFCVVCHGDYSGSNFMYNYNSGFPNRMVILDWQLAKYGSPAVDFLHFMFLSTDESFRRLHYDNMLQTYHGALRDHLERLGEHNATERFPLTTLMRLIRSQAKYAATLAVLQIPMTIVSARIDSREDEPGVSGGTELKYQTQMNGQIIHSKDTYHFSGRTVSCRSISQLCRKRSPCPSWISPVIWTAQGVTVDLSCSGKRFQSWTTQAATMDHSC
ncbi:uncharacterized protein LOC129775363 isoform X2 [Toxorhynchites rutilus septentrionalis]|uniref:uncharacterized protein LOC129775363 isoform X2 n=1 Tax=Toxorhynchites rutilus septentrionalis TaxID=329112 RepID=UPI0024799F32|nr:uncharacterized protein LOC129775363 isoform X2 [Toxorhynchites rutilus septentrionalis]XP_055636017.1 uncharacterized protein LOC129775363 isoform X2 [Toxorhynchites rutilus septentrionalis]